MTTPGRRVADARVEFDHAVYDRIVDDMRRHAGPHAPSAVWRPENLFPASEQAQQTPSFAQMVAPWIGKAAEPATAEELSECRSFLRDHPLDAAIARDGDRLLGGDGATVADLRSLLDLALILTHSGDRRPLDVLEVGGGYGRLAEAFLRMPDWHGTYLLVDAVPASLYYAHAYLQQALPDRDIGAYHADGAADLDRFDAFVVPPWHLGRLERRGFDVAVNIASFQEMTAEQVDHYIALFDELVRTGGLVYLCNSRVYRYTGGYRYPARWRLRFKEDIPFSYLDYKPTEIFTRSEGDWSRDNAVLDRAYLEALYLRDRERYERRYAELKQRSQATAARLREVSERRAQRIRELQSANAGSRRPRRRLASKLRRLLR